MSAQGATVRLMLFHFRQCLASTEMNLRRDLAASRDESMRVSSRGPESGLLCAALRQGDC